MTQVVYPHHQASALKTTAGSGEVIPLMQFHKVLYVIIVPTDIMVPEEAENSTKKG